MTLCERVCAWFRGPIETILVGVRIPEIDETLILTTDRYLSEEEINDLRDEIEASFRDNKKVIVLPPYVKNALLVKREA